MTFVCYEKSSKAECQVELKSPFVPLFQRGNFLRAIPTPLWKRGEGEIFHRTLVSWNQSLQQN